MPQHPVLPELKTVPFLESDADHRGLKLRYRVWGDPSLPPIIFQHGGKDHGRSWDFVIARLVDRFCCIAPDVRGHGDSGWVAGGGYDLYNMVTDFACVIDDLKARGIAGPYHIVGHSLGGIITLHYAAACPDDVLTYANIEGLGFGDERFDRWASEPLLPKWSASISRDRKIGSGVRRAYPSVQEAARRLASVHPKLTEEMIRYLTTHGVKQTEAGWVWKHDPALSYITLTPSLTSSNRQIRQGVKAPTTLFYGAKSMLGPFDEHEPRVADFPKATRHLYPESGHWLHHDQIEQFTDHLVQSLEAR